MNRLQKSCEHVSLELRRKTSETVSSQDMSLGWEGASLEIRMDLRMVSYGMPCNIV